MNKNNLTAILIFLILTASYFFPARALAADYDFLTLKYSSSGNVLLPIKSGEIGVYERGEAVAFDPDNGDIYVAGGTSSSPDNNGSNWFTDGYLVKYDSSGNIKWTEEYVMPGFNYWHSIAFDSSRNAIYVVGGGFLGVVTARYDTSGSVVWSASYGGVGSSSGGVAIDQDNGDVYVSGSIGNADIANPSDAFVVRYNKSTGNAVWQKISDKGANEQFHGIAVDSESENIYAAGSLDGDFMVTKYDKTGAELAYKVKNLTGYDWGQGVSVNEDTGNVYVSGGSSDAGRYNFLTIKYDSALNEKWVKLYDVGIKYGYPHANAMDEEDEKMYVAGYSWNGLDYDFRTIKYDSAGTELWNKVYDTGFTDQSFGAFVDNDSGEIYVTGLTNASISNISPTISNLSNNESSVDYCTKSFLGINLSWNFSDPDSADINQKAYRVKITRNSDGVTYDSGVVNNVNTLISGSYINSDIPGNFSNGDPSGFLRYNSSGAETYSWEATVYDSAGASDGPKAGPGFSFPKHKYPDVGFAPPPPAKFIVNTPIDFQVSGNADSQDNTKCYPAGNTSDCKQWIWDFDYDGTTFTNDKIINGNNGNWSYSGYALADASYKIVLQVTDKDGYTCNNSENPEILGTVRLKWKEVVPK